MEKNFIKICWWGFFVFFVLGGGLYCEAGVKVRVLIYRGEEAKIFLKKGVGWVSVSAKDIGGTDLVKYESKTGVVYLGNNPYRGRFLVCRCGDNEVCVVNEVDIEDYVKGVLFNEISHYWPIEVIKAQAIIARTYALYQHIHSKGRYWDLSATEYDQVYRGINAERYRLNVAVDETKGLVLTCGGEVLKTFYCSCCGGRTDLPENVWGKIGGKGYRGCYSIVEDSWCKDCPYTSWRYCLSRAELVAIVKRLGYRCSEVYGIEVKMRDESGRVSKVVVETDRGKVLIDAHRFRMEAGSNRLKSLLFEVAVSGGYICFVGSGWGHGVGLCQWGAYNMAKNGYSYDEILRFYYPGSKVSNYEHLIYSSHSP